MIVKEWICLHFWHNNMAILWIYKIHENHPEVLYVRGRFAHPLPKKFLTFFPKLYILRHETITQSYSHFSCSHGASEQWARHSESWPGLARWWWLGHSSGLHCPCCSLSEAKRRVLDSSVLIYSIVAPQLHCEDGIYMNSVQRYPAM